ncbi:DUF1513 domain-containing protein [Ketobacter sp.]|uniref:DUF1513 domain-containing protein n=1 Tax=Ketobacter sp. TaxID=2083498 RepID=UPI000F295953|nr:DUF1513 domain-containing protein [Ketobacter sp.]RLT98024.1 MAG: DUF1513 domain-containing protein [Ketobacter sp.]
MLRRDFCKWPLLALVSAGGVACSDPQSVGVDAGFRAIFSGCDDARGTHYIAHLDPAAQFVSRIAVPQRVHGSVYAPQQRWALFFARRPGTHLYVLDTSSGHLIHTLENAADRHFYGHGVVSADGHWLYTTENNLTDLSGVIGVYSLQGKPNKVAEFASGGIGPHQLALMPDGQTLVIANGGMATHPSSEREVLNLESMAPNLAYLDLASGAVLEYHEPPHHKMSIRHLDVALDGRVVFGVQYQGELTDAVPLVGSHRRGEDIQWLELPEPVQLSVKQYTASVAVDAAGETALVSCPRGNLIGCWDLDSGKLLQQLQSRDAAGLFRVGNHTQSDNQEQAVKTTWVSSNGVGEMSLLQGNRASLRSQSLSRGGWRWDNHLTVI